MPSLTIDSFETGNRCRIGDIEREGAQNRQWTGPPSGQHMFHLLLFLVGSSKAVPGVEEGLDAFLDTRSDRATVGTDATEGVQAVFFPGESWCPLDKGFCAP